MEKSQDMTTADGAVINVIKNSNGKESDSALFIVHGLAGTMHQYAIKRAADYFEQDFDVYRFNLYPGNTREKPGRNLIDCTLQTHADDLNRVIDKYAADYENVFLIGHSYGGPTIMLANPERTTAVSLWDPSYDLRRVQKEFSKKYVEKEDYYTLNGGTSLLIGKSMYEEAGQLDADACATLAKNFNAPVQVITAANGCYSNDAESYHSYGNEKNIRDTVSDAGHCFHEGNTCDELLEKTRSWFTNFK